MPKWSSLLSLEGNSAILMPGRRRPVMFQPATLVTVFLSVRASSAPKQVTPTLVGIEITQQ